MPKVTFIALASLAFALAFGAAEASTIDEASQPGGAYSSLWSAPTPIGAGVTTITGTGNGGQFDNFVFTALKAGSQSLTLDFAAPAGVGYSYAAGGTVLYSTQPFAWSWDGTTLGSIFTGYWSPSQSLTLALGPSFTGQLYLALNFTFGSNLGYSVNVPSNALATPAPIGANVPLPAGGMTLATVLGGLGVAGWRRRGRLAGQPARGV